MAINIFEKIKSSKSKLIDDGETDDYGFDEDLVSTARLIRPDGSFNIKRKGNLSVGLYGFMIEMSWVGFFLRFLLFYFCSNAIFAVLIMLNGVQHIRGIEPGTMLDNFFQALYFSVQTFTTVGYGHLTPEGVFANMLSALIAFFGLMTFALATGLFFARFSRPKSHILFSDSLIIGPSKFSKRSLQFRVVNNTNSQLIDLEAKVTLSWIDLDTNLRRFESLELEMSKIFLFPLNWTLVHHIDESSPLYKQSKETLRACSMEFLVLITGYDETYNHSIHSKRSYSCENIIEDVTYVTMYETVGQDTILHLNKLNETVPASPTKKIEK